MIESIFPPTNISFFDSHCHFDFPEFDSDREGVWRDCVAQRISSLLIPGVEPSQWKTASRLADAHAGIFYAAGLHPWWIKKWFEGDVDSSQLCMVENLLRKELLRKELVVKKCVAVGECGLDAAIETSMQNQLQVLEMHVQLASELNLPLILHCRKAHNELLVQLKRKPLRAGGIVHAFSGSFESASEFWSLGFCVGIGGTITYERAHKTRDAVKRLPIEAIVLETDAPDMPLCGKQGQRNSPQYIPLIAKTLADIRGESVEYIAYHTHQNTQRILQLAT